MPNTSILPLAFAVLMIIALIWHVSSITSKPRGANLVLQEDEIIQYCQQLNPVQRSDVLIGSGDDAAVTQVPPGFDLVTTTDSMVTNVHFLPQMPAQAIGHRLLAASLSDCAAMGATPAWATLNLSAPQVTTAWLHDFCHGFFALAKQYNVQLIGGDVTTGPTLTLSCQVQALIPSHKAIRQQGAQVGDDIYVTGSFGGAGLAVAYLTGSCTIDSLPPAALQAWYYPNPRLTTGKSLIDLAHSAIDISDGLLLDLQRMLTASQVGARVYTANIPCAASLQCLPASERIRYAATAGDDYELCFTAPFHHFESLQALAQQEDIAITRIGQVTATPTMQVLDHHNKAVSWSRLGYKHKFASEINR